MFAPDRWNRDIAGNKKPSGNSATLVDARSRSDPQQLTRPASRCLNPQLTLERELVLRLASLLWRLRHATTIETGLSEIQAASE
jgi:hypothetical protein